MGTSLTGQTKSSTYDALLKVTDNGPVGGTEKVVTDGLGNDSAFKIGTAGCSSTGTFGATGLITASAGVQIGGGSFLAGKIYKDANEGTVIAGQTGVQRDLLIAAADGSAVMRVPVGTATASFPTGIVSSPVASTVFSALTSASLPLATTYGGFVRTTSDVTYTTNTTLANISGLSVTVGAGEVYAFEADLHLDWTGVGYYRFSVAGTATATAFIAAVGSDSNSSGTMGRYISQISRLGSAAAPSVNPGTGIGLCRICGTITVNAGGTLTIQAAQGASTGASTIKAGSTFRVRKIT